MQVRQVLGDLPGFPCLIGGISALPFASSREPRPPSANRVPRSANRVSFYDTLIVLVSFA
jgi:hypothetical protein